MSMGFNPAISKELIVLKGLVFLVRGFFLIILVTFKMALPDVYLDFFKKNCQWCFVIGSERRAMPIKSFGFPKLRQPDSPKHMISSG